MKQEKDNTHAPRFRRRLAAATGHCSMIELHGDSELLLFGCQGIIDYDCETILINTLSGQVEISGHRLCLSVFRGDILQVEGHIVGVRFCGGAQCD